MDVRLDTDRHRRRGIPEIIFGAGKSAAQIIRMARRLQQHRQPVLITRLEPALFPAIQAAVPRVRYDAMARLAYEDRAPRHALKGLVVVTTAGTADIPVAEEARRTLLWLGSRAVPLFDVGVAGIHRVLQQQTLLRRARVIIVVAGMEGALASVVGGLVRCPVIAVPTSVGYGANFQGLAPLLTMLNSCAPGVGVVNIDNGFGAAYLAHLINTTRSPY
jgi:NCAIR mutase (PurE)-related protein